MDVKIEVKPEAVQDAVVKAITDSAIGANIRRGIEKILTEKDWHTSTTIVDRVVGEELRNAISKVAQDMIAERQEEIRKLVEAKFTHAALEAFVAKCWDLILKDVSIR